MQIKYKFNAGRSRRIRTSGAINPRFQTENATRLRDYTPIKFYSVMVTDFLLLPPLSVVVFEFGQRTTVTPPTLACR